MYDDLDDTYGYDEQKWRAAKEEAKFLLRPVARRKSTIPYSELTAEIKAIKFFYHEKPFFAFLGQISAEEDGAGRGMMTAVVVHKTGDYKPGPGFYECAVSLGKDVSNIDKLWSDELHKVYDDWQ